MFIYYNANPKGLETSDCVIRAISLACNIPYEIIEEKLYYIGKLLECDPFCLYCYSFLLDEYFKYPRLKVFGMSINDFAKQNPKGVYLVRVNQHLSVVCDSDIYDIWDCGNEIITDCWITKE